MRFKCWPYSTKNPEPPYCEEKNGAPESHHTRPQPQHPVKSLDLIHPRGWGDSNVKLCEGPNNVDYLSKKESLLSHIQFGTEEAASSFSWMGHVWWTTERKSSLTFKYVHIE